MKNLKKIAALVLALVMVFALTSVAFAANNGDVYTDDSLTNVDSTNNTIPLKKGIIFFNANGSSVYEPNITYTYSVAPVTEAALLGKITDDGELNSNVPVTVQVNAGVADGVKFVGAANTITFASTNAAVTTEANGVKVEKSTNLTVDLSKFTHAGVYRYLITEADNSAAVTAAGMVRDTTNYSRERYLDVYISNVNTGTEADPVWALRLTGAVIFKTNAQDTSDPVNTATTQITTTTEKTTGFEPGVGGETGDDVDYTSDTFADHYTTYDFTISKTVTGGLADKTHEFPFYVTVSNTINGAAYTYIKDNNEAPATATADGTIATKYTAGATTQTVGTDATSSALTLKDGDSITFRGVPSNQTVGSELSVMVKEFNTTVDQYTASVKAMVVSSGTATETAQTTEPATGIMAAGTGTAALATAFDIKTNDTANQEIKVTNNLSEISPTGYVVRFAPFALILMFGVGIFVFLAVRRRKEQEEA